jgi:hypothetical protein
MTRLALPLLLLLAAPVTGQDGFTLADSRTDQALGVAWRADSTAPGVWVSYLDGRGHGWTATVHGMGGSQLVFGWWGQFYPDGPCHLAMAVDAGGTYLQVTDPTDPTAVTIIPIGGRK